MKTSIFFETILPIRLRRAVNALSDIWQANVNPRDPYYSNALLIMLPAFIRDEEVQDKDTAISKLVDVINQADKHIEFADGKTVSVDGKVALHTREQDGVEMVRIGFRTDHDKRLFFTAFSPWTLKGLTVHEDGVFNRAGKKSPGIPF